MAYDYKLRCLWNWCICLERSFAEQLGAFCRGSGYITARVAFVAFPLYANSLRELFEGYWGGRNGKIKKKSRLTDHPGGAHPSP